MNKFLKLFLSLFLTLTLKTIVKSENTQITILRPTTINSALKIAASLNQPILVEKIQQNEGLYAIEFIEYLLQEGVAKKEELSDEASKLFEKFFDEIFVDCSYFLRTSKEKLYVEVAQYLQILYNFKPTNSPEFSKIKSFLNKQPLKYFSIRFILNICKIKKSLEKGYVGPRFKKSELSKMSEELKLLFNGITQSEDFQKILKECSDLNLSKIEKSIFDMQYLGLEKDYTTLFKWLTGICATCTIIACYIAVKTKKTDFTHDINTLRDGLAGERTERTRSLASTQEASRRTIEGLTTRLDTLGRDSHTQTNQISTLEEAQTRMGRTIAERPTQDQVTEIASRLITAQLEPIQRDITALRGETTTRLTTLEGRVDTLGHLPPPPPDAATPEAGRPSLLARFNPFR